MVNQRNNRNSGYLGQKVASTAFKVGAMLSVDTNGFLTPGGTGKIVGISLEEITSASSNFATNQDLVFTGYKHDDEFIVGVLTTITAGAFVVGQTYTILTVGTTDYTLIGASANTIGVVFVATGVGAGTGTATTFGLATQTLVGELVDVSAIDPRYANIAASTNDQLQVVRIIDSATIVCRIAPQFA